MCQSGQHHNEPWSTHHRVRSVKAQGCFWVQFERKDHGRLMMSRLERDLMVTAELANQLQIS